MKEIRNRWLLRTTTFLVLTACFSMLSLLGLAAINLQRILTLWGDDIQITVYMAADYAPASRADLEKSLSNDARIGHWEWVPRERALKNFETQMASYAPDLLGDDDLLTLIPPSFQISLAPSVVRDVGNALENMAQELREKPGVEEVRYGQEWVKKYSAVVRMAERSLWTLGLLFIIVSFFVISNVVRATLESRRGEIEILELIGASSWMIRRPLVIEGLALGGAASLAALGLASLLFSGARELLMTELNSLQLADHVTFLPAASAGLLFLMGPLVGGLAAYLCARRLNSGWAASRSLSQ